MRIESAKRAMLPVLLLLLAACGRTETPAAPVAAASAPVAASAELQALYDRSCRSCHAVPGTGAPLTGDAKAWAPRVAQGIDTLLDHTINGFQSMPPMGACMDCSEEQFEELIELMSGTTFD
ncbi:cytochrome c5 family protein [Solimonas sp. SE-A11]|uniref:c-type cytochrome n=1 Tax=Solimonas sp. SE-A11 TaxID=3054954 RepID=UPI00259CA642|nr:c-type cytochrome [Solimonas sp. SE-A11]MDM4769351.1 c-type cytochrome [Solimonas sp. SE-A11]